MYWVLEIVDPIIKEKKWIIEKWYWEIGIRERRVVRWSGWIRSTVFGVVGIECSIEEVVEIDA